MFCAACGTDNPAGQRFCNGCGTALAAACTACGSPNPPGANFCGSCGGRLEVAAVSSPVPVAERRLVSVLFADLVGFTSLSEDRDAEEVRELLSRYFETCRRLIEVYGGTVEKFIRDAVMAVWGAPVATEQDAERAVRAGLDLVAAVSALGDELGVEGLRARVGVLAGEAAVTIGAVGEGMVAGDLVNTASRIQGAAEPGTVLVGDSTRRATEAAVVYEPAGTFELRGKQHELALWRAVRIVSGAQGSLRSERLEAPFVGRDRELRQIKELFHACADEGRAHVVSVTGIGGIGKSRLAWEFFKYIDGLAQEIFWHRGRCLAYGEGVAYWALADMVRMRCRIAEDEAPDAALAKLRATLDEVATVPEERERLEPRLAQLLGLGEQSPGDRNDLFAAWRLFFERLAEIDPVILVFEDMQWADDSLLDFVEYLLDWSRSLPIFVVTLARPELLEKRHTWGAAVRNLSSLHLEPLQPDLVRRLLEGLVPGLPDDLASQIVDRSAGVPLYAVETVRALVDRGLLAPEGAAYRLVGEVESLEVPETLHALIASRLDGLPVEERRLLQDAAILGRTFTAPALAALTGRAVGELEAPLTALVRKEILGLQADPRSPEFGQYGFLQDLVRHVVYETLSRRERRQRHLAAADALAATMPAEEVAEVLAAHLAEAYALDPDAEDADEIRDRARDSLVHAAERASALAAAAEACRYLARAAELCAEEAERGELERKAGNFALQAGLSDWAEVLLIGSAERFAALGDRRELLAVADLAWLDTSNGQLDRARERLEAALVEIDRGVVDPTVARIEGTLGNVLALSDEPDLALAHLDRAVKMAEALGLNEVLVNAVISKAIAGLGQAPNESRMQLMGAMAFALEADFTWAWLRALNNLTEALLSINRFDDALRYLEDGLEVARRIGDRSWETMLTGNMVSALVMLGRWDEAVERGREVAELGGAGALGSSMSLFAANVYCARGELDAARELIDAYADPTLQDSQLKATVSAAFAALQLAAGEPDEAFAQADIAIEAALLGPGTTMLARGVELALEAARLRGDVSLVHPVLDRVASHPLNERSPWLRGVRARAAGLLGDESQLAVAEGLFRETGMRFHVAVTLLDRAEASVGEASDAALDEATAIFAELGATPWLERAEALAAAHREPAGVPLDVQG